MKKQESSWQEFVSKERSPGVMRVIINGHAEPVFQEETWDAEEEAMTRLIFTLEGKRYCALSGRLFSDLRSEYVQG